MSFHRYLFTFALTLLTAHANAADWKECERAKLRQLNLEQRSPNSGQGKKNRSGKTANSRRSAANLDEWLWKNCRSYANELRRLEQSRM